MILPTPNAPFSKIKNVVESITVDGSWDRLVLFTGHHRLLPNCNEFTEGRVLTEGTHTFSDNYNSETGLQNLIYPWIAVYDSISTEAYFFLFNDFPSQFQYIVNSITYTKSILDSNGKYILDCNGKYIRGSYSQNRITSLVLYPRNGVIYYGKVVYPNCATISDVLQIPDVINKHIEGSVPKFLKQFGSRNGPEQILDSNHLGIRDANGKYIFSHPTQFNYTEINIDESTNVQSIQSGFLGFSMDSNNVINFLNETNSQKINNLFQNLGIGGCIRFGINELKTVTWNPDGEANYGILTVINKTYVNNVVSKLNEINWNCIWALNLSLYDPTLYADQANYIYTIAGSRLIGIEIGNEPDMYWMNGIRSTGYVYSDYIPEWEAYKDAIKLYGDIPLVSPDTAYDSWMAPFVTDAHNSITCATHHHYPVDVKGIGIQLPTIENLLSIPVMDRTISKITTVMNSAKVYSVPFSMNETNSCSGRGKWGLSDSFAATLWAIDYMFSLLKLGVVRANFEGVLSEHAYAPIDTNSNPKAIYYAMLFVHYVIASNGVIVNTGIQTPHSNIKSYSVLGSDGKLRTVVINKNIFKDSTIIIKTQNVYTNATIIFIKAKSLNSTSGFTFGDEPVSDDGLWAPRELQSVLIVSNKTSFTIPYCSAAIITFS